MSPTKSKSGVSLLLSESWGQYIPKQFATAYHFITSNADCQPGWKNVGEWQLETCLAGPEDNDYWEAWDAVLSTAEHIDQDGNEWTLLQDGDLWAICPALMTNEEKLNFGFDDA